MTDGPSTFPPLRVELDHFGLDGENNIFVRLRFSDGSEWDLEWSPDSTDAREVFDFFADLASRTVARIGQRGFAITGLTPVEEDDE